jgi:glycosyltransferase involved in cell wall biosynthesis
LTTATRQARLAFVAPRFGPTVVGGAEALCRLLATNLTQNGTPVDVITTCAVDHHSWDNVLPKGESRDGPLRVRRFAVGPRDPATFARLHGLIDRRGRVPYDAQVEWMANSVWSPGALRAAREYDRVVVMPYLFGTSFWQQVADPDRTVVIPCLHDEPHAHQTLVLDALCSARGVMLNSAGEGALLARMVDRRPAAAPRPRNAPRVVGCGFDHQPAPDRGAVNAFAQRHGVDPGYLLYAGRREPGKGLDALYRHYATYRRVAADPRPLALMGTGPLQPPPDIARHVVDLGFVSPGERALAYGGAGVLVQPSRLESFGMVLFEAWLAGTPVLVSEESEVLRSHCVASGGGMWFRDAATFSEAVQMTLDDPALGDRMARAGRDYALDDFGWSRVRGRFLDALDDWA